MGSVHARFAAILLAGCVAALVGCSPPSVRARGVTPLNLNTVNESTPVDVRFYQLTEDGAFLTAPFETLWTDAPKVLGGTLLGKPLVRTVWPGPLGDPPVTLTLAKLEDGTRYLGVLALFRAADGTPRQLVIPLDNLGDGVLELTGYGIRFNTGAAGEKPAPEAKPADQQGGQKPVETTEEQEQRKQDEQRRQHGAGGRR